MPEHSVHDLGDSRPEESGGSDAARRAHPARRSGAGLQVLRLVLATETIVMLGVVGFLVVEQFVATPFSRQGSIALTVLAAVGLALVAVTLAGAVRRAPWVRGAAITWQILQLAAAWTLLQGDLATLAGVGLTVLSIVGVITAVLPATFAVLKARDGGEEPGNR